jgi:redox-sensing transcriptional repressor
MVGNKVKQIKVSNNVIRRLPRYLRKLDELKTAEVERISSGELGRQMGLTSSQIRQDFSCFGEFGQQGYGYNVSALRGEIASILGTNRDFSVILVGVGNIGRALIENFCFEQYGFHLQSAYDVRPELIGKNIGGITIHDISELPHAFENNGMDGIDVAVLCVPKSMANIAAEDLVRHGIHAIWNFTNVELSISDPGVIVENIHFSDSLLALGYYLAESLDERAIAEAKKKK